MENTRKLRMAMSDMFDWSVHNVRSDVDQSVWLDIRRHFSEIKGVLDECHSDKCQFVLSPDDVLDSLEMK